MELLDALKDLGSGITADVVSGALTESDISSFSTALSAADKRKRHPNYERKLAEAAEIVEKALKHRHGAIILREAITTDEFSTYFGDVLDRALLARFQEWQPQFPAFLKTGTFGDLTRSKRMHQFRGGGEVLTKVGTLGPYPERGVADTSFSWTGSKYGADFRIAWETLLADDLGGLRDLPGVLAGAARAAESKFATELYVDSSGPHASLYTGGNGNIVTSNPVLSITALKTALTQMTGFTDPETGHPLMNRAKYLVVPPALELAALEILNSIMVQQAPVGATSASLPLPTVNVVARMGLELIVDPWIPIVATSNGSTSWFLFADPNAGPLGPGLAAAQFDRMRGMEAPLLLQKRADFTTLGGGADPRGPLDEMDAITYRVVHAFGGGQLFWQASMGSNGSGS